MPIFLLATTAYTVACDTSPSRRETRAGMAIALETRQTATTLARAISNEPDPACGTYTPRGPMALSVHWIVEGLTDSGRSLQLDERRHLEIDGAGHIRYRRQVDFVSAIGREGQRRREWRYVDDHVFTRDQNLPFERRQADVRDRARLLDEVPQVFETLVRATRSGWTVEARDDGLGLAATPEGEPVRCGRGGEPDAWLDALLGRGRVIEAEAEVRFGADARPLERRGEWRIALLDADPPAQLRVTVAEVLDWEASVESVTAPSNPMDTRRERLHHQLGRFLRAIDEVPARSSAGTGEGTSSRP